MQAPQPTPSEFTEARITNDVLDNFHAKSKAALAHEGSYYKYFGPMFKGNYGALDPKLLVFAFLQMSALDIRGQFDIQANDFRQLYAILARAEDQTRAAEVRETATCAYKTAEARTKAHIKFLDEVAQRYGETGFFKELEIYCCLDWAGASKFQKEADHLRQGPQPAESGSTEQGEGDSVSSPVEDGPGDLVEPESSDSGSGSDGSP